MRIIIDIDGVELVSKAEQPQVAAEGLPEAPPNAAQTAEPVPPASLLKTAATLGAGNAGSAPSDLSRLTLAEIPLTMAYGFAGGQEDAGSAPVGDDEGTSDTKKKRKDK